MEPPSSLIPEFQTVVIFLLLFLISSLFVAVESAVIRSHASILRTPDLINRWGTKAALSLLQRSDLTLSSTQLGITAATVFLGWIGLTVAQDSLPAIAAMLNLDGMPSWGPSVGKFLFFFCSSGILIWAHVVIGELLGKAIAVRYPEATLRMLAPLMTWYMKIALPLISLIHISAIFLTRLLGMKSPSAFGRVGSSSELAALIAQSSEEGVLDEEEKEMLHGIIGFSETVAREVMTPRADLVVIPVNASKEEVIRLVSQSGLSRFPVIGETIDHIEGILIAREIIGSLASNKNFSLKDIMRDPYFVPGTKPIDDLLNEFKRRKIHMAIVLDEHGGVDGVVTLEDLIEEIVGEIYDESDVPEAGVVAADNGDFLIDGGIHVADVNEEFSLNIPEGEYDTIGGFVFAAIGRIPVIGDSVLLTQQGVPLLGSQINTSNVPTSDDDSVSHSEDVVEFNKPVAQITVERVDGSRIETLRISRLTPPPEEVPSEGSLAA